MIVHSGLSKISPTHPDRPWGPPSLLYNGYQVLFPLTVTKFVLKKIMIKNPVLSYTGKVKVKESCNRPSVAQRVPGGLGPQIFMTFAT